MPDTRFRTEVDIFANVPLELGRNHTILFKSKAEQTAYFNGKRLANTSFTQVSYQRHKSGVIKLQMPISVLGSANYMRFCNPTFENIYFYAYIVDIEYINNNVSQISYIIDALQTWMFDYSLNSCFVEREHAETDNIGDNRVNEGLDTGPFVQAGLEEINAWASDISDTSFYVIASQAPDGTQNPSYDYNVYSALYCVKCATIQDLNTLLTAYMNGVTGSLDPIISITEYPSVFNDPVTGKTKGVESTLLYDQTIGLGDFKITEPTGWNIRVGTPYYLEPDFIHLVANLAEPKSGKLFESGVVTFQPNDVWYIPAGTKYYSDAELSTYEGTVPLNNYELGETEQNGVIYFTTVEGVIVTKHYVSASGLNLVRFFCPIDSSDPDNPYCTLGTESDYHPKNNKLFTYPYNYMVFESPDGSSTVLRFEDFRNNNIHKFVSYLTPFPMAESVCAPKDYETINETYNFQNALYTKAFPTCGVASDAYSAWYAQNKYAVSLIQAAMDTADAVTETVPEAYKDAQVQDDIGKVPNAFEKFIMGMGNFYRGLSGAASAVGQAVSNQWNTVKETGVTGAAIQGYSIARAPETIMSKLLAMYAHKAVPDTIVTKANAPSLLTSLGMLNYRIYYMKIRPEYAEMIDNYFSCYGYAVKRVKKPNIKSRTEWNYIKTVGCTISGNVPGDVEHEICALYDAGMTFWHNPNNVYRYDLDNPIDREAVNT